MPSTNPYNQSAAFEAPLFMIPGAVAGVDFTGLQYVFVKLQSTGTFVPCVAGDQAHGVSQDHPLNLQALGVLAKGISKVVAGANITAGQAVSSDLNGNAVPQSGSAPTLGYAMQAATIPAGGGSPMVPVLLV